MRFLSKTNINFISKQKFAVFISVALIIAGITSLVMKGGPLLSIDFTGGIEGQVQFDNKIKVIEIKQRLLNNNKLQDLSITEFGGSNEFLIKTKFEGTNNEFQDILFNSFKENNFNINRIDLIGPKIGKELQRDAIYAVVLSLLLILLYIGIRFDFYYALGSMCALAHDVAFVLCFMFFFLKFC